MAITKRKKIRGERVPLSQPLRTVKETTWAHTLIMTKQVDVEMHQKNPSDPLHTKTHFFAEVGLKNSTSHYHKPFLCLIYKKFLSPFSQQRMHNFIFHQQSIQALFSSHKGILSHINNFAKTVSTALQPNKM